MRTIITTVGTSLLSNKDDRPWSGWRFESEHPNIDTVLEWLKTSDLTKASAEIHTWQKLGILEKPTKNKVVLIHSQTPDGKYCAECLKNFAEYKKLDTKIRQINGLSYSDAERFNRGLSNLVRVLAETIRSGRASNGEVAIAATGGFKAEIAIANLVGALLGSPVYYIYEQFEQLVKLEPIPISLKPEWLCQGSGKALLDKLDDGALIPRQEIESLIKADGRLEILLESDEINGQEKICSNVLGEFAIQLLKTPPVDWPTTCQTVPEYKNNLQDGHHRPKGWERKVERLLRSQFVRLVRCDNLAGNQQGIQPVNDNTSDIHVVINDGRYVLRLRVETTSENVEQRRLLIGHFRQRLRL